MSFNLSHVKAVKKRVKNTDSFDELINNRLINKPSSDSEPDEINIEYEEDSKIRMSELDDFLIKSSVAHEEPEEKIPRKKKTTRKKKVVQIEDDVKKTRGPGRPRKTPKREPVKRDGIANKPINTEHIIEFLYDTPMYIKKIIGFFKSLASNQIQFIFRPTEIILFAKDHNGINDIRIRIDCSKVNYYFCEREIEIGMNCKDLELTLNKIDKDCLTISILALREDVVPKNLIIITQNEIQIDEKHTIDVIGDYDRMSNEETFLDNNYMLDFTWPGKYFRKTISDIKSMSGRMSIVQNDCEAPLEFEYVSINRKIQSKHIVKNPKKINFHSRLDAESSFRVDIKIEHIRPVSAAHIADNVIICVDEHKKLMTKAYLDDETIEIKTLTQIINDDIVS